MDRLSYTLKSMVAQYILGEEKIQNISNENNNITRLVFSLLLLQDEKYKRNAEKILGQLMKEEDFKKYIDYFNNTFESVDAEIEKEHNIWENRFKKLKLSDDKRKEISCWFFPENRMNIDDATINKVRDKRRIKTTKFNRTPITNPFKEILFTSNILLTMPREFNKLPKELAHKLDREEEQKYWYDHPIPLDIDDDSNEIIYGLRNLNEAVKQETNEKLNIALSVSCTHPSIKQIAKDYIKEKLAKIDLSSLNVYIFTEDDTRKIIDEVFKPILKDNKKVEQLYRTFGVDGNYGRHYSFLKAIASFWNKIIDENIIATFKIDLDQVFPQDNIYKETGSYAFEKFKNNKWGAIGRDNNGRLVRLGMIAGALVNDSDIEKSLYEPDVKRPQEEYTLDQYIFNSYKPQYISTVAEMGTLYSNSEDCIMRFHVTGGMNGILIEDLNRFRPFTPRFIARAEDQAYILSVLFKEEEGTYLRYYHQDNLIMRHDKGSFLSEDLKKYEIPKLVGDYERIMLFSHYGKDILKDIDRIKETIYPFTGSFITRIPYTVTYFRALFKAYELAKKDEKDGREFLDNIVNRMPKIYENINSGYYHRVFNEDKEGWNIYYDTLTTKDLQPVQGAAKKIIEECELRDGPSAHLS